jgi:Ca2+-binding RTX toxin-like protein
MATVVMNSGGFLFGYFSPFLAQISEISVNAAGTLATVKCSSNYEIRYEGTGLRFTRSDDTYAATGGEYTSAGLYAGGILIATMTDLGVNKFRLIGTEQTINAYLEATNTITDSAGNDSIDGGNLGDRITLSSGNDSIDGEAGNDRIIFVAKNGSAGALPVQQHVINGNLGTDTLIIGNEFGSDGVVSLVNSDVRSIEAIILRDGATLTIKSTSVGPGHLSETLNLSAADGVVKIAQIEGDIVNASGFEIDGTPRLEVIGSAGADRQTGNRLTSDLLLGEGGADRLFGLDGKDTLIGDDGRDWLDGGRGADIMVGGADNDTYVVADRYDRALEGIDGSGIDTALAAVTLTLGQGIEHGHATGRFAVAITGNELNNHLTGNAAKNSLSGQAGADRLIGGAGNDVLRGGADRDVFVFASGHDRDRIIDFAATGAGDRIDLRNVASITDFADLKSHHMKRDGANVVINAGSGDVVTLINVKQADLGSEDFIF